MGFFPLVKDQWPKYKKMQQTPFVLTLQWYMAKHKKEKWLVFLHVTREFLLDLSQQYSFDEPEIMEAS